MVHILGALDLRWDGVHILVHESAGPITGKLTETVAKVFVALMTFPSSDSRWLSVGRSCRCLIASLYGGLAGLMQHTRSDSKVSDYYLHGFDQLDEPTTECAIIGAIASGGTDAILSKLLADDRLGLSCTELEKTQDEELLALEGGSQSHGAGWQDILPRSQATGFKTSA